MKIVLIEPRACEANVYSKLPMPLLSHAVISSTGWISRDIQGRILNIKQPFLQTYYRITQLFTPYQRNIHLFIFR